MSIELKQAAQQALDAFDAFGDDDDFASLFALTQKMNALHAAVQQAESEPVEPDTLKDHQIAAMVNTLRDIARQFHGHDSLRERIANVLVPALKAEAQQPATGDPVGQVSDLFPSVRNKLHAKGFGSDAPLYTHPAPGVPDDVARDAGRYRWLRERMCGVDFDWNGIGIYGLVFELPDDTKVSANCDATIDAAIAASPAQKGSE